MNNAYFVFNYYHNKNHSAWVPLKVINSQMSLAKGYGLVNPEEHVVEFWQEKCLRFLEEQNAKFVFSCPGKNSIEDNLFGFPIHCSADNTNFFHYDFLDPQFFGSQFKEHGIDLRVFDRR